jgi:deoxyribodipyrimidine photo-lyase
MTRPVIVWFRRDLRLADHAALAAALADGRPVLPVYIHAPHEDGAWRPGAASDWWLHHALAALDADLRARGSRLMVYAGDSLAVLRELIGATGADAVHWSRCYEPAVIARDAAVKSALKADGNVATSHNAALLSEPWTIATGTGGPYRVFTPYWRALRARLVAEPPLPAPARVPLPQGCAAPLPGERAIADLGLLPRIRWDAAFAQHWQPGEAGAWAAFDAFVDSTLGDYQAKRDFPAIPGTSRLGAHLHFGAISPRQILWALTARGLVERGEFFLRELGWREFGHHLLYHYPHTTDAPLSPRFANFPWAEPDPELLAAWQRGRTGIPIVDAGMRELWTTGFMHNRVRMIVASFLTKNLRYHWLHGARWFWDTLVDADLANNTQGWQWSAGSGADAAPYFRIFNPVAQGERFDADGAYVQRWCPELAGVAPKHLHAPWTASRPPAGYPRPIVDLRASREAALAAWRDSAGGTGAA